MLDIKGNLIRSNQTEKANETVEEINKIMKLN